MGKMMTWLEGSFAPKLQKIANMIWIVVIKDSLMQALPVLLAGSVFSVGTILNNYISWLPSFWVPYGWTMSKISLLVAFLIPFNYCEKKRYRKQRILAGATGLLFFMICSEPQILSGGVIGQGQTIYGPAGMFVAILTGVITGLVFGQFAKFSFFKEDSVIPDFVKQWFDSLLPVMIIIVLGWLVVLVGNIDIAAIVSNIFMPLQGILNTWYGFIVICFLMCFIYSMGISTWILTPVTTPVLLATTAANLELVAAGTATTAALGLFTQTTVFCCYLWIGGVGATLSLVILMCFFCRSNELKALGKACIVPSIVNINEPIVFGAIAWNPLMMIPMWMQGIVLPALTWIFTKIIPFAPIPRIQFELWYCPYPICTFISSSGSVLAIMFTIVCFLVSGIIWFPFLKVYDRQKIAAETSAIPVGKE